MTNWTTAGARLVQAIPVVKTTAARDASFPVAEMPERFRVENRESGWVETVENGAYVGLWPLGLVTSSQVFNPMDPRYGAAGDGVTDDATAFQDAETERAAVNGILMPTPGKTYLLESTVVANSDYVDWRAGMGTILLAGSASVPAARFGGAQIKWLRVDGLQFKAGIAGYRVPIVQFGASGFSLSRFELNGLKLDMDSLSRDGAQFLDCFNGLVSFFDAFNCSAAGPIVSVQAATQTSGNIHFDSCGSRDASIMFLLNNYASGSGVLNSIQMSNCKMVRGAGVAANVFAACTVAAGGAAAGQAVINLTAGQGASSGIAAGHWVTVANGSTDVEVYKVLSVATDAVTLSENLRFALSAGHPVILGNWHTVAGRDTRGLLMNVPHFEKTNGLLACGVRMAKLIQPVNDSALGVYRDAYAIRGCQGIEVERPFANATWATTGVVLEAPTGVSNTQCRVIGPTQFNSGGQPASITAGAVAYVGRGGGWEHPLGTWYQLNPVNASQTAAQLTGPNTLATTGIQVETAGFLYGLRIRTTSARSAGTLTAIVYVNGSATALTAVLNGTNTQSVFTELQLDTALIAVAAGDVVDVRVTTDGSWAPTVNNLTATVYVSTG